MNDDSPKNHRWRIDKRGCACCDRCGARVNRHGDGFYTWRWVGGTMFARVALKDGGCVPKDVSWKEWIANGKVTPRTRG